MKHKYLLALLLMTSLTAQADSSNTPPPTVNMNAVVVDSNPGVKVTGKAIGGIDAIYEGARFSGPTGTGFVKDGGVIMDSHPDPQWQYTYGTYPVWMGRLAGKNYCALSTSPIRYPAIAHQPNRTYAGYFGCTAVPNHEYNCDTAPDRATRIVAFRLSVYGVMVHTCTKSSFSSWVE